MLFTFETEGKVTRRLLSTAVMNHTSRGHCALMREIRELVQSLKC